VLILIIPILYYQFAGLVKALPGYFEIVTSTFYPKLILLLGEIGINLNPDIKSYLTSQDPSKLLGYSNDVLGNVMASSMAFVNVLSLIFVTPILVFYMIRDWNKFIATIDSHIPPAYAGTVRKLFKEIDRTLSGYIRGQLNVCMILGLIYGIGLAICGLNFGFLIGFLTGIMSFIPYVGMLSGVIVAVIVGLFQAGFGLFEFAVMGAVFLIGQLLESNLLTPKLVGDRIGLHPIWVIFGLFACGILFGFMGLLFAVPITAIVGVVVKFLAATYKKKFVH
jgi:predicted PurR-regulated permease PerM